MQSLASQFHAFIVTMLMGLTIGLLFDFYKFAKGIAHPGKILGYIADVLFWAISTLAVFSLLLIGNWGEIRLYVVIGVLIGAVAYFKLLSYGVLRVLGGIFYYVKKISIFAARVIGMIWVAVTYPFILVKNIVIVPIGYLSAAGAKTRRAMSGLAGRAVVAPLSRAGRSGKARVRRWWISLFKKSPK